MKENGQPPEDTLLLSLKNNHLWVFEDGYEVDIVTFTAFQEENELYIKISGEDDEEAAAFSLKIEDLPRLTYFLRRAYQKYRRGQLG